MQPQIPVGRAISIGLIFVNGPVILMLVGPLGAFIVLSKNGLISQSYNWTVIPAFLAGFVAAWVWWSFSVPRWRVWAYERVNEIGLLKERAVAVGLTWPDTHVFGKTEFKTRALRDRERKSLAAGKQKGNLMTEAKKPNIFWPNVDTPEGAKNAAGYGTAAAIIVAVVTAGFATWALMSRSTVVGFIDAWAYFDAAAFSAVAFGIFKEKRFAAIAGLTLYLLEKAYQIHATGKFPGAVLSIFITIMFLSSVRGTFALHRIRSQSGGQKGDPVDGPRPEGSDRG